MNQENQEYKQLLASFSKILPHFADGRIDYSDAQTAVVLTVFIKHNNQILLLKRSDKVRTYQHKWNTVAGYLDNPQQTLKEKIFEELNEETSITSDIIASCKIGSSYQFTDAEIKRTWFVFPAMVTVKGEPNIHLDWEHDRYQWIYPADINEYDTVPNLNISLSKILAND